jgi:Holliday junction resolvase|tara:strand:+ start:420 stop:851 length:432 start_codon:yes stop_codon:yes gene_type:complete
LVNARNKGRRGEREVIDEIKELLGIELEVNYAQTFGGGHDLISPNGYMPYAIEVKRRKAITQSDIKNWWDQTVRQAKKVDLLPCLWFRQDRADWKVAIPCPYSSEKDFFPVEDVNIASIISPELWAAIAREEYNIGTRDIITE